jgi:hypothetical protein
VIDAVARRISGIRTVGRRISSRSFMPLFLLCMGDIAPYRIRLYFMILLVLSFMTRSSWSSNLSECSERKRTFSNSNVKDKIPNWGKSFQTESIIGAIEDDILLDNQIGWVHEHTIEIMMTLLESGPTPCRVLVRNQ